MDRDFIKSAEEHSSLSLIALYVCLLGQSMSSFYLERQNKSKQKTTNPNQTKKPQPNESPQTNQPQQQQQKQKNTTRKSYPMMKYCCSCPVHSGSLADSHLCMSYFFFFNAFVMFLTIEDISIVLSESNPKILFFCGNLLCSTARLRVQVNAQFS